MKISISNSLEWSAVVIFLFLGVVSVSARYHTFDEDVTLTSEQKEALDLFKEKVSSRLPNEYMKEDIYLIRWLRSKNFDLRNAEKALMQNLKWREVNSMDKILEEDFTDFEKNYKTWFEGRDKSGKPILYFEAATHDTRRAVVTGQADRYLRYVDREFEKLSTLVRELGVKYGNVTRGHLMINAEGYNLIVHGCVQCIPIIIRMLISIQEHWPLLGDGVILVNTPSVIEPLINVAKSVMTPEYREALQIYGTNKKYWKKILAEEFDFDQLPPGVGGTKLYKGMEEEF